MNWSLDEGNMKPDLVLNEKEIFYVRQQCYIFITVTSKNFGYKLLSAFIVAVDS